MHDDLIQSHSFNPASLGVRVPFDEDSAVAQVSQALDGVFQSSENRDIIIVCVGTDRSTGDAFGPLIGTKIQSSTATRGLKVYGTLNEPVHAVNLASTLQQIDMAHPRKPLILAVDACLGKFDHVGHIILEKGPLRPGAGVKKSLPEFGDYTLTGVVNVCGFMEYFVLQNTRLAIVMRMTEVVVNAIQLSWQRYLLQQSVLSVSTSAK